MHDILNSTMKADLRANGFGDAPLWIAIKAFFTHPGFAAICCYRAYARLYPAGGLKRAFARALWLRVVRKTGCYISPYCEIGAGLSLKHASGIVIGDGARIGADVSIYQNVTIGVKDEGSADYPRIEDGVCIYAGACVLGGIRVGENAVIGANAVVLDDVPADAAAVGIPAQSAKRTA